MQATSRIVLHPVIPNIQVSWVKMGADGAAAILGAGANDLGGVLMDESITRAAGGVHGQLFGPEQMVELGQSIGRTVRQRTTLYRAMPEALRSEEHTSELQSLMRISHAVFCLKKKNH